MPHDSILFSNDCKTRNQRQAMDMHLRIPGLHAIASVCILISEVHSTEIFGCSDSGYSDTPLTVTI